MSNNNDNNYEDNSNRNSNDNVQWGKYPKESTHSKVTSVIESSIVNRTVTMSIEMKKFMGVAGQAYENNMVLSLCHRNNKYMEGETEEREN